MGSEKEREANEEEPLRERGREREGKLMIESVDCVSMDECRRESEGMEGREMKT